MRLHLELFAALILAPAVSAAPLAGAWEAFPSQANNDAWSLYSYSEDSVFYPVWQDQTVDPNPYTYSPYIGGEGVWLYATDVVAQGAFVGDYGAQKIEGVDVSVLIDPAEIEFIDLAVYADGPLGLDFYYSSIYVSDDFGTAEDWYNLSFSFSSEWFVLQDGSFTPFQPDETFLASVEEVGLRVFPVAGTSATSGVGVDEFILVPTVKGPELDTSVSGDDFVLNFTLNPGVSGTIETMMPDFQWQGVVGQTGLTGSQVFTTPIGAESKLFRVGAEEKLTQVISP